MAMTESATTAPQGLISNSDGIALRRLLLIELSVLRRRYSHLTGHHQGDDDELASIPLAALSGTTPSAYQAASMDEEAGALCQSDRDAIEALFHSIDDFTLEFNEAKGEIQRDDIVSTIMGDLA
ncbi:hypothetical protein LSCM1_04573 [Leishmania martiniquensis]|uniref:Uncharacterized protein n=1 Tax=Leishmania martiniquensis TaxID=1580590 RepID=A0A836G2Q2_9TRYP|nr:hypothetical protein LSCM1_04573 [Leishmania martiniquensis]